MYQQQIPSQPSLNVLTGWQIKQLMENCYYLSNIVLPGECTLESADEALFYSEHPSNKNEQSMQKQIGSKKFLKYQHLLLQKLSKIENICVQLFYLIFNCLLRNYSIKFKDKLLVLSEQTNRFVVIVKQISEKKSNSLAHYTNYFNLYLNTIQQIIRIIEDNTNGVQKSASMGMVDDNKYKVNEQNIQKVLRELTRLHMDADLIKKDKNGNGSSTDKCEFISKKSLLYKIRNLSISIILFKYQTKKENKDKLIQAIKIQKKLKMKYQQEKILENHNKKQLIDIMRRIRVNFEKYIKQTWNDNPMYVEIIQKNMLGRDNTYEENKNNTHDLRMFFKTKIKPIEEVSIAKKQEKIIEQTQRPFKEKQNLLQFSIQYNISKSTMSVRLLTHLLLDASNIDILNQQWSTLTFQSSVVSVEVGERGELMKQRKKYLMVKSATNIQPGQPLIQRCLCLMDTVLTGYKCIQDQISCNGEEGYSEFKLNHLEDVYKKINHYVNIMREVNFKLINNI